MSDQAITIANVKQALDGNYILLLTTNSVEKKAVQDLLANATPAVIPANHSGCRLGWIAGRFILHVTGTSGAQSSNSIGRITRQLLSEPSIAEPALVMIVGVGWGNPLRTSTGDVVIANEIWAVNHIRHSAGTVTHRLDQRRSPIDDAVTLAASLARALPENLGFSIRTGPLASGESYYADPAARDALLAEFPAVLGGEMEAYDLVPDLNRLPWLVIKGISDYAGDATDRSLQPDVARRAAALVAPLLGELSERGDIAATREDWSTASLSDAMIGQSIHIGRPEKDGHSLNDHLNDRFGPQIMRRLERYASDGDPNGSFPRLFTDVLLELAQNAMRHGNASHATINFNETSVNMSDDGLPYDVNKLSGDRGGHRAWSRFHNAYMENGAIHFQQKARPKNGNLYKFKLAHLSLELRTARDRCRITINKGTFGAPGIANRRLNYDPECATLYFDVTNILMMSRRLDLLDEMSAILATGRGVFIACHNQEEKLFYEQGLAGYSSSKLRIFVLSRL